MGRGMVCVTSFRTFVSLLQSSSARHAFGLRLLQTLIQGIWISIHFQFLCHFRQQLLLILPLRCDGVYHCCLGPLVSYGRSVLFSSCVSLSLAAVDMSSCIWCTCFFLRDLDRSSWLSEGPMLTKRIVWRRDIYRTSTGVHTLILTRQIPDISLDIILYPSNRRLPRFFQPRIPRLSKSLNNTKYGSLSMLTTLGCMFPNMQLT